MTTQFNNEFSKEIYELTYKYGNENINDTLSRVAKTMANTEIESEYWEEQFKKVLNNFAFIPGGRILSNAGLSIKNTSFLNCFVSGFRGTSQDSMESIMDELKRQSLILKSEGGYGINIDVLRPRGSFIGGVGVESPGPIKMLEMWDKQSEVITEGSGRKSNNKLAKNKIRKGAQLVSMACWNPSIEEFITAKHSSGKLNKFNMSVLVSDKFIENIKNHKPWSLIFPAYDDTREDILILWKSYYDLHNDSRTAKQIYNEEWNGNVDTWQEKGYPVEIYKTFADANELWDLLMKSTYNYNEPGVLFVDTINRLNNLYYDEYINATNPCVIGDTKVLTNYGWIRMKNLHERRSIYPDVKIVTRDEQNRLQLSLLEDVMLTEKNAKLYCTLFETGEKAITNGKHKFYKEDYGKISVEELHTLIHNAGDVAVAPKIIGGDQLLVIENIFPLDYCEDVYDLTANPNYNFYSTLLIDEEITITTPAETISDLFNYKLIDYYFKHSVLNVDCGEEPLPPGNVCLLGNINLTQFIKDNNWDYDKLGEYIPTIIRFMDNVNDITYAPLQEHYENLKNKRRLGMGVMGYASALIMMNIRYGGDDALKITEELMQYIANTAYRSSAVLAKEKGAFSLYIKDKYLNSNYIKLLSIDTLDIIRQYGIRNSHLLTIAPTGNTSIIANNVSGGLEPLFLTEYRRTFIITEPPVGLKIPKIDWVQHKIINNYNNWNWVIEGQDDLIKTTYNGVSYKIDKNRGLTKEAIIKDYAISYLANINKLDTAANYIATTDTLSIDDHINTMEIFAKWTDAACSKTLNFPQDYEYDEFKDVYFKAHSTGKIKGFTTYRAGTMANVLSSTTDDKRKEDDNCIHKNSAPKRPKVLECDIHQLTTRGEEWLVLVGLMCNEPYEIFAFKRKLIKLPSKTKEGKLIKVKSGNYTLETNDGLIIEDITSFFEQAGQEALTRMISMALRHGADIKFVIEQLNKSEADFQSFAKSMSRALKKYIKEGEKPSNTTCPNCGKEDGLIYVEGCVKCKYCSHSLC